MNFTFSFNNICTPKSDDFSAELRKEIQDKNILTIRTRKKLLSDLDDMASKNNQEKRKSIRNKALEEIYTSEVSYLQQLEKVIKYFMQPMKSLDFLSQSDYNTIFGNIETIYNVNGELLKELEDNLNNVAFAFLKLAPFFKLYSFYAYDYKKAISIIQNMQNTNPEFKKFLETQENSEEVQMKLPSLLITPIQRVPRYRLLLKQVLDHTSSSHPHHQKLAESLQEVERTAEHINSLVEEHDNIERMLELQRSLHNNYPCIIKPGRRLIKEGTLMKMSRKRNRGYPRYFVLMSDIVMYCKVINSNVKTPNSLQCCCILPLNKCKIEQMLKSNSFKLTCQNEIFVLYSDSLQNTESWIKTLKQSVNDYVECRKTLRKDSSRRQPMRKKYDMEFDYLGLSPGFLKQKRKFQDFEDVFYVNPDENTDNNRRNWFPFKKRSLLSESIPEETPSKKSKLSEDALESESHSNYLVKTELFPVTNSKTVERDSNTSKLYNMFCRIKDSVKNILTFK